MKRRVLIVGAGPAGLMAAASLDKNRFDVTVLEKNNGAGRKFLVAGDGGLNITHSEDPASFTARYTPQGFLDKAFASFDNHDLQRWLRGIGIDTFTGTSGRVFPVKQMKPIAVLKTIIDEVKRNGAEILYRHSWEGFSGDGKLLFSHEAKKMVLGADIVIFALGGASWPVTGSAGDWLDIFSARGVAVVPFRASNCAVFTGWPEGLATRVAGKPLKNIAVRCGGKTVRGEIVITAGGLEGSGIYPLSPEIRGELEKNGQAHVFIDLKPAFTVEKIVSLLSVKTEGGRTAQLRKALRLDGTALALLKQFTTRDEFDDDKTVAAKIKALAVKIMAMGPINEAISTAGGISRESVDDSFMLKALPGHYAIGEMLDYDAPTGGYLLQSCFSMGFFLASHLNKYAPVVE